MSITLDDTSTVPSFNSLMETIGFNPSFFRDERDRAYSDGKSALARENFQNSIDANATRIDISIKDTPEGCEITFKDNGEGMNEDILRKVYFKIGATTKTGELNVGGFGRARILTCFAMDWYRITTRDCVVNGKAERFNISTGNPYVTGCTIEVLWAGASAESIESKFKEYLLASQLDCVVYINGVIWNTWLHKNREVRSFDWGTVYANKSSGLKGYVIVRVRGAMMFVTTTNADAQVVLEIDPALSRQVLQSNRDGLMREYRYAFDAFLNELAIDKRTALQEKVNRKTTRIKGGGMLNKSRPSNIDLDKDDSMVFAEVKPVDINLGPSQISSTNINNTNVIRLMSAAETRRHLIGKNDTNGFEDLSLSGNSICPNLFDVYIDDDVSGDKMRSIINNFNPVNWVWTNTGKIEYRKGADYLKLLMLWKVAIDGAIEAAFKTVSDFDSIKYSIGWVFSDTKSGNNFVTGARCKAIGEEFFFLLNPVNEDLVLAYSLRSKKDLVKMIALALHEVAHVFSNYHDEDYARTLTIMTGNLEQSEILRNMKAMLDSINE